MTYNHLNPITVGVFIALVALLSVGGFLGGLVLAAFLLMVVIVAFMLTSRLMTNDRLEQRLDLFTAARGEYRIVEVLAHVDDKEYINYKVQHRIRPPAGWGVWQDTSRSYELQAHAQQEFTSRIEALQRDVSELRLKVAPESSRVVATYREGDYD